MPDGGNPAIVKVLGGIGEVPAAEWDACAGTVNPFLSHAFLSALEDSGAVSPKAGWLPQHLVLQDEAERTLGCVPMYAKSHSYGEYVFDHGWADAYERAGGRYYPKLQIAVPFTPVTGPRLLVRPGAPAEAADALIAGIERVAERHGIVTAHATFPTRSEWELLGAAGWLQRTGQQYHWENRGYGSFDDFLADLNARKRKAIRKERREVRDSGVAVRVLTGGELEPAHWDHFHRFYIETSRGKWGVPYLNREFFHLLGERMADRVALVMAERDGRPIAGALNLIGDDTLFGRNWGCDEDVPYLHFEACYYRAIDFAIARGLARVEAGAQGEHKIQRGYLPTKTYSAHLIRDSGLRDAVADFLARESRMVDWQVEALGEAAPFRKPADPPETERPDRTRS
jgi:hypothetical protein